MVPPFAPVRLLTAWQVTPVGVVLALLCAVGYGAALRRAARRGLRWPWWRVCCFYVLGVGTLLYALCGPLAVYRTSLYWVGCLQVAVLSSVTPVGLALGDPTALVTDDDPSGASMLTRILHSPVARVLTFPLVSSFLAVGTLVSVFFTGYFEASTRSTVVATLLYVQLLFTGCLFVLPLLTDDLLPAWATPPVRTLLGFVDGLLDAIPGIFVMTAHTLLVPKFPGFAGRVDPTPEFDQLLGGGVLLAVAEAVGLPLLGVIFLDWVRSDDREARASDALLDAAATEPAAAAGADGVPPRASLWWENDPRFADRIRRRP